MFCTFVETFCTWTNGRTDRQTKLQTNRRMDIDMQTAAILDNILYLLENIIGFLKMFTMLGLLYLSPS